MDNASKLLLRLRNNLVDARYPEKAEEVLRRMADDFGSGSETNQLLIRASTHLNGEDYAVGGNSADYAGGQGLVTALKENMAYALDKDQPELQRAINIVEQHIGQNPDK